LVKEQLGNKTHWQDSNDLEMMFQGTYTSDFYRNIRNLLHEQVSLCNGVSRSNADESRALERRWQELLVRERHYRTGANPAAGPAAAGSAAAAG
jgi:anaerobic magnesium-protoporphyrin IX monomethyl ester cyclase